MSILSAFCLIITLVSCSKAMAATKSQPNPPVWPSSVRVFDAASQTSEEITDTIALLTRRLTNRHTGHFSMERYALLFLPGTYENVSVEVGYYVQVAGLGLNADDVCFAGSGERVGVYAEAMDLRPEGAGSLDTFWRAAENFHQHVTAPTSHLHGATVDNSTAGGGLLWAVSQAAPLRRVRVTGGDLRFSMPPLYASGGFAANVRVERAVRFGSQQQWMLRNAEVAVGADHSSDYAE